MIPVGKCCLIFRGLQEDRVVFRDAQEEPDFPEYTDDVWDVPRANDFPGIVAYQPTVIEGKFRGPVHQDTRKTHFPLLLSSSSAAKYAVASSCVALIPQRSQFRRIPRSQQIRQEMSNLLWASSKSLALYCISQPRFSNFVMAISPPFPFCISTGLGPFAGASCIRKALETNFPKAR